MTLNEYQKKIDAWASQFEKPYWAPLSMYAALVEEVGEVGRLLNHIYGDKPKKPTEARQELDGELADLLMSILYLANAEGIDLEKALDAAIQKSIDRDSERFEKKNTGQ